MEELCQGCDYNLTDLVHIFDKKETTLDFLCGHKLLARKQTCPKCKRELDINDNYIFRCDRRQCIRRHRKVVKERCQFFLSAKTSTWFAQSHLSFCEVIVLTYLWNSPKKSITLCAQQAKCSVKTVITWFSLCREVALDFCVQNSSKLGGVGKTVEVDEAKFGKRKYDRSRAIEGTWVVGGVERDSSNIFLVAVEQRDEKTLLDIITNYVIPGTHVVTNCWSSYKNLSEHGYLHSMVNHSLSFVDPASGAHTQNIEREWRKVKAKIPRFRRKEKHLAGYLAESIFKCKFPVFSERFHNFLLHAGRLQGSLTPRMAISSTKRRKKRKRMEESESSHSDDDQLEYEEEQAVEIREMEDDYLDSSSLEGESFTAYPNRLQIKEEDLDETSVMALSGIDVVKRPKAVEESESSYFDGDQHECEEQDVEIKEEVEDDYLYSSTLEGEGYTLYPNSEDSMEIKEEDFDEVYIKEEEVEDWEGEGSANGSKMEETEKKRTKKVQFSEPESDSGDSDDISEGDNKNDDKFADESEKEEEGQHKKSVSSDLADVVAKTCGTKKSEDVTLSKAKTDKEVKKPMNLEKEDTFEIGNSSGQIKEPMKEKIKEEEKDKKRDISLHDREMHEVKEEPVDLQPPEKKSKRNVLSDNFYKEPTLHGWNQQCGDGDN